MSRTSAKILFTVTDFLDIDYVDLLNDVNSQLDIEEIVVLRGSTPNDCTTWEEFIASGTSIDEIDRQTRSNQVTDNDLCHILFTSGTTGKPKGAMLEHAAVCRSYQTWCEVIGLTSTDRYLVINPFFHTFGLNAGILACLMTGATLIPLSLIHI